MNKDNAKDYLPLVQALAEGKVIQVKCVNGWEDVTAELSLCFAPDQYRIKPEPRELWANRFPDGYETSACFISKAQAWAARSGNEAVQVRYREVIE